MADDDAVDTPDELTGLVLGFLRDWPSPYASPSRIAHAIGKPTTAVVEELARLKRSGEYPTYDPPPPAPARRRDGRRNESGGRPRSRLGGSVMGELGSGQLARRARMRLVDPQAGQRREPGVRRRNDVSDGRGTRGHGSSSSGDHDLVATSRLGLHECVVGLLHQLFEV